MSNKFQSRYLGDKPDFGLSFAGIQSMAKQSFKDEADINNLVARFDRTGVWSDKPATRQPRYGDFTSGEDYRDIQNRIAAIKEEFAELPSDLRRQFNNDPSEMLDFLADPENAEEAIELGLLPASEQSPLDVTVPTDSGSIKNTSPASQQEGGTGVVTPVVENP